jgi:hypothetical protein
MTVNASDVDTGAGNVMEFANIGTTNATVGATIDESAGLMNVIVQ